VILASVKLPLLEAGETPRHPAETALLSTLSIKGSVLPEIERVMVTDILLPEVTVAGLGDIVAVRGFVDEVVTVTGSD